MYVVSTLYLQAFNYAVKEPAAKTSSSSLSSHYRRKLEYEDIIIIIITHDFQELLTRAIHTTSPQRLPTGMDQSSFIGYI